MATSEKENFAAFFARLENLFSEHDLSLIRLAYQLGKYNHRWQTRKGKDENGAPIRYFEHLRGVALILIDDVGCYRPEMIISALMHDILEDVENVGEHDLYYWFGNYGAEVSRIVRLLSKKPEDGYLDRLRMYGDWKVLLIKSCDRLHNLRSLVCTEPEFQLKTATETRNHYIHLLDTMLPRIPKAYCWAAFDVIEHIEELTDYYLSDNYGNPDRMP